MTGPGEAFRLPARVGLAGARNASEASGVLQRLGQAFRVVSSRCYAVA